MKVGAAAMQQKSAQISNNQDRIFQHKQQYSHYSGHPLSGYRAFWKRKKNSIYTH
jgi:hypothetical protein